VTHIISAALVSKHGHMPGFMRQDEKLWRIAAAVATAGDGVHGGGRDVVAQT
jgi:hypothetical protein